MTAFTYTAPSEIDGDPAEVRAGSLELLRRLSLLAEDLTNQAVRQVSGSGVSEAIEAGAPSQAAVQAYQRRRPKEAALTGKVMEAADDFRRLVGTFVRASEEYTADPDAALGIEEA